MYKLLLVDDEKNIRNGIKNNCNWEQFQIAEVDTASNGAEALKKIQDCPPDFLITDIKMPVMDGLTLTEKVMESYPDVLCAVISGYDEFDLVRTAMQHNVRDYLLKPCSIEAIHELLKKLLVRKEEINARKKYWEKLETEYAQIKYAYAEQILKDYIVNAYTRSEDLMPYRDIYELKDVSLRLILMHIDNNSDGKAFYSLQRTCRTVLEQKTDVYVCTPCNECLLLLIPYYPFDELLPDLHQIRASFRHYFPAPLTVTVGEKTHLGLLKSSYKNLYACSDSRFYAVNDGIITTFDRADTVFSMSTEDFSIELLCLAIQCGNSEETNTLLNHLYQIFEHTKYDTQQIRAYLTHIYVSMIQLADASIISKYLDGITKITTLTSLREIINLLRSTAADIMSAMQFHIQHQQNELIKKVTGYVDEHLTDNHLTLSFIAHKLLYVNVDYLGKLFNAEYGEKFSAYLTRRRVELAASMLLDGAIPVNEIALKSGFGYNSQYFSKVFKKSTGYTPTEYRTKFSGFSS